MTCGASGVIVTAVGAAVVPAAGPVEEAAEVVTFWVSPSFGLCGEHCSAWLSEPR